MAASEVEVTQLLAGGRRSAINLCGEDLTHWPYSKSRNGSKAAGSPLGHSLSPRNKSGGDRQETLNFYLP